MGHTAPVKCIAKATAGSEAHHVVTSSENGEMFAWDTVDGRCLENRKHPGYIHTSIQVNTSVAPEPTFWRAEPSFQHFQKRA